MSDHAPGTHDEDYQVCSRCIMDNRVDRRLTLVDGVCNHCRRYDELLDSRVSTGEAGQRELEALVAKIKKHRNKDGFDCLIGVSGGVDSTYVALQVKRLGLNPLALHVDNGWNSEVATANIEKALNALDIELHTEVLDLREFYDLQRSFLSSGTPDGDIPADHAIDASMWRVARRHGLRYVISGMNFRTEAVSVPDWAYGHSDWRYIRGVHKRFGKVPLRSYPHFGFAELFYTNVVSRVRIVSILNYLDYSKADALTALQEQLDWTPYGGKHFESIFTRYYQGYFLPRKFGIDKRYGHLSDLVNSGEITRAEALESLKQEDYPAAMKTRDEALVKKKLGLSDDALEAIFAAPNKTFREYPNSYAFVQVLRRTVNLLRSWGVYPK